MAPKTPALRITGGKWRSRLIQTSVDSTMTRPTMDQTRQAVFNILNSAAWALKPNGQPILMDATILDCFAGSGSMGFEALSRDAVHVTLLENHPKAITAIQENIAHLQCTTQAKIIRTDVLKAPMNMNAPVAICFLDPPYQDDVVVSALTHLKAQKWIDEDTLIVLESSSKTAREMNVALEGVITIHDQRRYGHALVTFGQLIS